MSPSEIILVALAGTKYFFIAIATAYLLSKVKNKEMRTEIGVPGIVLFFHFLAYNLVQFASAALLVVIDPILMQAWAGTITTHTVGTVLALYFGITGRSHGTQ